MITPGQSIRVVSVAILCADSVASDFTETTNYTSIVGRNMKDVSSAIEELERSHSTM
jgi:hypothetical protein